MWPLTLLLAAASPLEAPTQADVCSLLARPQDYLGKTVTLKTQLTVGRHLAVFRTPQCKKGVALHLTKEAAQSEAWQRVEHARFGNPKLVRLEIDDISAQVTAVFEKDSDPISQYHLRVIRFDSLVLPPEP